MKEVPGPPPSYRLRYRPLTPHDEAMVLSLNEQPEVMRFINGGHAQSREQVCEWITSRTNAHPPGSGFGIFLAFLTTTDEFIGWFCLKNLDNSQEKEVGYRLHTAYWG